MDVYSARHLSAPIQGNYPGGKPGMKRLSGRREDPKAAPGAEPGHGTTSPTVLGSLSSVLWDDRHPQWPGILSSQTPGGGIKEDLTLVTPVSKGPLRGPQLPVLHCAIKLVQR